MDYGCLKTDFFINYFVCFYLKLFYCLFDYMCQRALVQLIACFLGRFQVKGYLCNQNTLIMCKFSESTKQKLGNAIIYIAHHTSSLSKTKLLKLLYLMEERMALKYHVPFIGIPFEVWQAGPVAKDVFIDLSDGPYLLKSFVKTDFKDGGTFIEAVADFDDSEFSECEIEMMDEILAKYGNMTASDLVAETHKEGTLWYRVAARTGLLEAFNKHECNNSDWQIDFAEAMTDCAAEDYRESLNIRQTANLLNAESHV